MKKKRTLFKKNIYIKRIIFYISIYVFLFHQLLSYHSVQKSIKELQKKLIIYELFNILCQYIPE